MANGKKYYRDFREHIKALEERGKLIRIKREIDKDTELMPLVRWQFRGLEEAERKAFLFENVVDAKAKKYTMPVTVGTLAATTEIYAIGMMCEPEEIHERWTQAQLHPIDPVVVESGPAQEVVWQGKDLLNGHGLDMIPVPISTPGFDNAPYLTSANWITKDPETGVYNIGNYRSQIKAPDRAGGFFTSQHMGLHWRKCKARGVPLAGSHRHRRHSEHRILSYRKDTVRFRRIPTRWRTSRRARASGALQDHRPACSGDSGNNHRRNHSYGFH